MKQKAVYRKIFFPPIWLVIVLTVVSAAALIIVFVQGREFMPVAYMTYVISFYTLVVLCIACIKTFPGYYKRIKRKVYGNQYANRYLMDVVYKTHINLYRSLAINLVYVAMNAVAAMLYSTYWFGIFAVYYAILAMMRFLLIRYVGHNEIGVSCISEWKRARQCSYILLTINVALAAAVLMMIYNHRGFEYQGVLIYAMAMYTFYITVTAITEMIKYRKYHSPIMSVSKMIKLSASLFSMLFLETAMFSQFGEETSPMVQRVMIMATGGGISLTVVAMALYMIVASTKEIGKHKKSEKEYYENA